MALELHDVQEIDWTEYRDTWSREGSTSLCELPRDPIYQRYRCSLDDLLEASTYPVWFTDPAREEFVNYNCQNASPIKFAELAIIEALRNEKLSQLNPQVNPSTPLLLIVEHCASCDVRVVKDGCKRLLQRAHAGSAACVKIVEVSGRDWSGCRYDMRKLCRCFDTA